MVEVEDFLKNESEFETALNLLSDELSEKQISLLEIVLSKHEILCKYDKDKMREIAIKYL